MSLNLALTDLPPQPLTATPATVTAWLTARHEKALAIAANTLDLADVMKNRRDFDACAELIREATEYLNEANRIVALRAAL